MITFSASSSSRVTRVREKVCFSQLIEMRKQNSLFCYPDRVSISFLLEMMMNCDSRKDDTSQGEREKKAQIC